MFRRFVGEWIGTAASATICAVTLVATLPGVPRASAQTVLAAREGQASTQGTTRVATESSVPPARRIVHVRFDRVPLERALKETAAQAGMRVTFSDVVVAARTPVSFTADDLSAEEVMVALLRPYKLSVTVSADQGGFVVVPIAASAPRADGVVVGTIVHAKTKQPVRGATILVDDATKGVTSGEDGAFRLTMAPGGHVVQVRALGFERQSRRVTVSDGETLTLDFVLEPSASVLGEVIVTGTVVATERKTIPTPITVINADEIEKRNITRIEQLFRGEVPGVLALDRGGWTYAATNGVEVRASSQVYARGSSSLSGGANPLKTYVDGVELLDPSYLNTIDPKSIERVEIITGPQAATIYGSGAMGGVMQIFTKKGNGAMGTELTLGLRYGMLQNSSSSSVAPLHNDVLSVTGGTGSVFTYSGNLSYNYTGQWLPGLFSRNYGAAIGATHMHGPVTTSGSVSVTTGENGTSNYSAMYRQAALNGEIRTAATAVMLASPRRMQVGSQNLSFDLAYRATEQWQHRITVGKNQTDLELVPLSPIYQSASDTLMETNRATGGRTTASYSTTLARLEVFHLSSTLTFGANGSWGDQIQIYGNIPSSLATSYVSPSVSRTLDSKSWGGFGSWQLGVFDQLYFTFGLRGERNPSYGDRHKVDWTPTNGVTYTFDAGDVSVKLLGSYGRATRPPNASYRTQVITNASNYLPGRYVSRFEAPDLTPEYSRGPQGGVEVYWGNMFSFTVNRYQQTVTDLIQYVPIDSVAYVYIPTGVEGKWAQYQYQNVAKVRQQGWEGTGSMTVGPIGLRGTYSWTDSRILAVNPKVSASYYPGMSFTGLPSHSGSVTASYAHGNTSISLVTNYVGASLRSQTDGRVYEAYNYARHKTYVDRASFGGSQIVQPSYTKSDLVVSNQLSRSLTLTLNVLNVGNRYNSDVGSGTYWPTLGRQTIVGMSLRFPKR